MKLYCGLISLSFILFGNVDPATGASKTSKATKTSTPLSSLASDQDPGALTCGTAPSTCAKSRYRSIDGSCNNLQNPKWGVPHTPYGRLLPFHYADGVYAMPVATSGRPLPNPRVLSLILFPDVPVPDLIWTLNAMQWGQFITHDMSLTAGVSQSQNNSITCCTASGQYAPDNKTNAVCAPIPIPAADPVQLIQKRQCMNFIRTGNSRDRGCTAPTAPAKPLSVVTSYMDMSHLYGSSPRQAAPLREGKGGRLLAESRGGKMWPPKDPEIATVCDGAKSLNEPCYLTGDIRANQSPQLTVLHVLLLREHNRIAKVLASINPNWDDEKLFQETRRIVIAEIQHINYYEWLPIFLGKIAITVAGTLKILNTGSANMVKEKLIYPGATGYINDYDPAVDPSVLDEHATAAFRQFHSLIRGALQLVSELRLPTNLVRISDWFNRPALLETGNSFDELARGLATQSQYASDQFWDTEITQFLFKGNNTFGADLRAIDIQRGRDHALDTYVAMRRFCGLSVPTTFQQLNGFISVPNVLILQSLYEKVEDIDLVVGGSLENNVPGTLAGPTFLCILTKQFFRTRVADRYFFENGADPDIAFTPNQLKEIRKSSVARIICDNADQVRHMQPLAFQQISLINLVVPCNKLPAIDLNKWLDDDDDDDSDD